MESFGRTAGPHCFFPACRCRIVWFFPDDLNRRQQWPRQQKLLTCRRLAGWGGNRERSLVACVLSVFYRHILQEINMVVRFFLNEPNGKS